MNCVSSFPNCARVYSLAHKDIVDSELEIPGYKLFHRDRGNKGGGLAVYVRNDVKVMRRPNLEESTIEGLWVEVCPPKSRSFLVGTFYKLQRLQIMRSKTSCLYLAIVLGVLRLWIKR